MSQRGPCNRGGGYVTAFHHAPAPDGHLLVISGPPGAATQVRLTDVTYKPKNSTLHSHSLLGAGPQPRPRTALLLELLGGALTVPCGGSVDFAIALDWFNRVVDGAIGDLTDLADLVHRGKHMYMPLGDGASLRRVGGAVADEIAQFVERHPLLTQVDAIATPPGHDLNAPSFASQVAAGVAKRREIPLIRCTSSGELRDPIRSLAFADRADALAGLFRCPVDVAGQRVLIVDDVYASGATVEETSRALRAAGAVGVASVTAIRTMEFEAAHVTKEFAEERLLADLALAGAKRSARRTDPVSTSSTTHSDDDDWTFRR